MSRGGQQLKHLIHPLKGLLSFHNYVTNLSTFPRTKTLSCDIHLTSMHIWVKDIRKIYKRVEEH